MSMPYSSAPRRKVRYSRGTGPLLRPLRVRSGSAICMLAPCAIRWISVARATHEVRDVEDERDASVAHDGGARDAGHLAVVRFEVLDDDLVLADQLVHEQRDALALGLHHDDGRVAPGGLLRAGHGEEVLQRHDGKELVAHLEDLVHAPDAADHGRFQ